MKKLTTDDITRLRAAKLLLEGLSLRDDPDEFSLSVATSVIQDILDADLHNSKEGWHA